MVRSFILFLFFRTAIINIIIIINNIIMDIIIIITDIIIILYNNNNKNKSGFKEPSTSSNQTPLKTVQRRKEKGKEIREKKIFYVKMI